MESPLPYMFTVFFFIVSLRMSFCVCFIWMCILSIVCILCVLKSIQLYMLYILWLFSQFFMGAVILFLTQLMNSMTRIRLRILPKGGGETTFNLDIPATSNNQYFILLRFYYSSSITILISSRHLFVYFVLPFLIKGPPRLPLLLICRPFGFLFSVDTLIGSGCFFQI